MKKNYLLSAIAVCACLFTACNKENDATREDGVEENKEGVITHLRATGNENTSKGSIDGTTGDFSWNVGDQIAVWDNTNGVYKVSAELTEGDIAGDNATFTFVDLGARADFAVSPASIVDADHHTAADFSITLPGTYSLADVLGEKSPVPMIAVNDGDFLHFKQLGALLRVTLNNLPPSTKSVTIDFNGNKVWGSFPVASTVTPGSSYIVTAAASGVDAGKDVITINIGEEAHGWLDGQDVNIPVPAGTYTNITVKTWSGLNGTGTATLTMTRPIKPIKNGVSRSWKPIRTSALKVTASLPAFSVSPTKRVAIAKSNLQCTTSDAWASWTWSFMAHPWSLVETSDLANADYEYATAIGLFGWGTSGHKFGVSDNYGDFYAPYNTTYYPEAASAEEDENGMHYGPKYNETGNKGLIGDPFQYGDWGVEACRAQGSLNDGSGNFSNWRTPTADEYVYLFALKACFSQAYNTASYHKVFDGDGLVENDNQPVDNDYRYSRRLNNYGLGVVNGKKGMIVVPDYFVDPSGKFVVRYSPSTTANEPYGNNNYSLDEWNNTMAPAGAIFFPGNGYRKGTVIDGTVHNSRYWSSTTNPSNASAFHLNCNPRNLRVIPERRSTGRSVRLVRDLN